MKPIYAENIIVAIKDYGFIEWYVLEKDLCFLDYTKLEKAYRKKGYEVVVDDTLRFGIKIINELTKNLFLNKIKDCKMETDELRKMLKKEKKYHGKLAYNPSILIDFDNRILISHYAEPESFEYFIPDGWEGKYEDFERYIPLARRYWLDENGKNLIGE